ncbi:transcriptional factor, putative [gamma proteobacterium HTCC5015]|nr:transcriptional factor, putative [gamma proteobacterium HTCC5015]
MSDRTTLMRQWTLLQKIPASPRSTGVGELVSHLMNEGFGDDKRNLTRAVQRDLNFLSDYFPLSRQEEGTAILWSWHGQKLNINGMTPSTALAFVVARDTLEHQLPHTTLQELQPLLDAADSLLKEHQASGQRLTRWRNKVFTTTRGPHLKTPKLCIDAVRTIEQALLDDHVVAIHYRRRDGEEKQYTLHPLGIAHKEGVAYLVGCADKGKALDEVKSYALHRVIRAEDRYEKTRRPKGFRLEEYVKNTLGFPITEKTLRLKVHFDNDVIQHLIERPISDDQVIKTIKTKNNSEASQLTATVADNMELRWWLQGFGQKVEVIKPVKLRREFARTAQALAEQYANDS